MSEITFTPPQENRHWLLAASGLLETALVVGVSILAALIVAQFWSPNLGEALGIANGAPPDFLAASAAIVVQFAVQYGVMAALIAILGMVRGRNQLRHYAMVRPQDGWQRAVKVGVVAGLLIGIIPALVFVLQDVAPIGQSTPLWAAINGARWDWTFWLFMGTASFLLPPFLEEFAWRGYVLGRLVEGFSPGGALVLTSLIFALLHVQYLQMDPAMALTLAGLILASLAFGFLTLRSGSLVSAITAHVIINFPLSTAGNVAKIVIGIAVLIVYRRPICAELNIWARMIWDTKTLAVVPAIVGSAAMVTVAILVPGGHYWVGGLSIVLLVWLHFIKRSAWI